MSEVKTGVMEEIERASKEVDEWPNWLKRAKEYEDSTEKPDTADSEVHTKES
ncbi:MAG: hypothetical protein QF449_16345 [Alphaproteobacteria bacterium]|jgi:hypothetical protein|nr:hypothetical protein [Alphaproteobacteria bacterium]MDP6819591.1 hypothetical protein [Alphaproteobacteria bacterium]